MRTIKLNVMFCSESARIKEGGPLLFAPSVSNHTVKSHNQNPWRDKEVHILPSQSPELNAAASSHCITGFTHFLQIEIVSLSWETFILCDFWVGSVQSWHLWRIHGEIKPLAQCRLKHEGFGHGLDFLLGLLPFCTHFVTFSLCVSVLLVLTIKIILAIFFSQHPSTTAQT